MVRRWPPSGSIPLPGVKPGVPVLVATPTRFEPRLLRNARANDDLLFLILALALNHNSWWFIAGWVGPVSRLRGLDFLGHCRLRGLRQSAQRAPTLYRFPKLPLAPLFRFSLAPAILSRQTVPVQGPVQVPVLGRVRAMRIITKIAASCLAALSLLGASLATAQSTSDATIIHAGAVITDANSAPLGPSVLLVENGKITAIYPADSNGARVLSTDSGAQGRSVIDLSDKTILPGMIDLHTHLSGRSVWRVLARGDDPAGVLHADRGQERTHHGAGWLHHGARSRLSNRSSHADAAPRRLLKDSRRGRAS